MIETNLVQGRRRRITRNVSAVLGADAIRLHNHRHRVPAQVCLNPALNRTITRVLGLPSGRDAIQVGSVRAVRQIGTRAPCEVDHLIEEEMSPLGPVLCQHRIDRFEPLAGLDRINIIERIETTHKSSTIRSPQPCGAQA